MKKKMMRYKSNYSLFVDLSKQRDWNQSDVKSPAGVGSCY